MFFPKTDLLTDLWKGNFFDTETRFQAKRNVAAFVCLYFDKEFNAKTQRKFLVKLEKIGINRGTQC